MTVQVSQTKLFQHTNDTNSGISRQGAKGSRWQDLAEAVSFGAYLDWTTQQSTTNIQSDNIRAASPEDVIHRQ